MGWTYWLNVINGISDVITRNICFNNYACIMYNVLLSILQNTLTCYFVFWQACYRIKKPTLVRFLVENVIRSEFQKFALDF